MLVTERVQAKYIIPRDVLERLYAFATMMDRTETTRPLAECLRRMLSKIVCDLEE